MIKKPTAFVLGAGASQAYGFPLGAELVDQICDRIGHGNASVNTLARQMELDTLANGGGRGRTSVNTISDDPTGRSGKSKNAVGWRAGQGRAAVSEANEALTCPN